MRRPPYSIVGTLAHSVQAELDELAARARRGELIGLAYVVVGTKGEIDAGLAGSLGRDTMKAVGALNIAAQAAMQEGKG